MRASEIEGRRAVFRQPDPDGELRAVRLWQEVGLPGEQLDFDRVPGGWELALTLPAVQRLEYLYELTADDGRSWTAPDPTNPDRVAGVFGDKSELVLPGYTAPAWTGADERITWRRSPFRVGGDDHDGESGEAGESGEVVEGTLCEPETSEAGEALPLLLAHDGPEYDTFARLTDYLAVRIAAGTVPPLRVALLAPGDRDRRYSALPAYTEALTGRVLPALADRVAVRGAPVLAGVSLGALAALHAAWSAPGAFAGLWLQSGSFFTPATDPQERGYAHFDQICDFVRTVHTQDWPGPAQSRPRVAITCGAIEENAACNRLMAQRLRSQGLAVSHTEHPDVHSFTAWRDALDPGLGDLLAGLPSVVSPAPSR